jgi:hypothetical protein
MAVTATIIAIWDVKSCGLIDVYRRIDGWILSSGQKDRCMQFANLIPKREQETSEQTGQTLVSCLWGLLLLVVYIR